MCKHEQTFCPRCNGGFECKAGSISLCQCTTVTLTVEERSFIAAKYTDCLCANCLRDLKNEFHLLQQQERMQKISTLFTKNK